VFEEETPRGKCPVHRQQSPAVTLIQAGTKKQRRRSFAHSFIHSFIHSYLLAQKAVTQLLCSLFG